MVAFPGCKINLGLHILRKRPDGYHDIDTVFYPVPWSDVLEFLPANEFAFTTTGLAIPGKAADNLCVKAYHLLQHEHSLPPVQGHLHKIVPMGSGLGGGSADAAHTLTMLSSLFTLHLGQEQLRSYAARLGSDCAFFLGNSAAQGTGRGEILREVKIDLSGYFLLILVTPLHISTAEAYAMVVPRSPRESLTATLTRPVSEWKDYLVNDFEASLFDKYKELPSLKSKLYEQGAVYAAMSGSGSALYGLFSSPVSLETAFPGLSGWSGWL